MIQAIFRRHLVFTTIFVALAMGAIVLTPSHAAAEEEPLKLSLLNAAKKGGDSAWKTISVFLDKSDDINTIAPDEVWDEAEKLGLEEKDFRSSSLREENTKNFRELMQNLDIEALMILDVFSRGRKLQLVVIGPSGSEVADIREDIRRGRVSKSEARDVLKGAFKKLVPAVRDFRDAGGWAAYEEEEEEEDDEPLVDLGGGGGEDEEDEASSDEESASLKDDVVKKRKGSAGIDRGINLAAGLLIGRRSLAMSGAEDNFELNHASPFAGVAGKLDGIAFELGSDSAIGFAVFGGYAPFTTIFDGSEEFASQYARLAAEGRYIKAFSDSFRAEGKVGFEATSITIEQNRFYTGNRYVSARLGAGIGYGIGPALLELSGVVLPVFSTNNSDGAFGDSGFSLGFEPSAGLSFNLTDEIEAALTYTLQFYQPEYPEPVVLNQAATSTDTIHTGLISIGYGL